MWRYQRDDGDAGADWAAGALIGLAVVVGVALAAFMIKVTPVVARCLVNVTRLLLPQFSVALHNTIGWPDSGRISSQAMATGLGMILYGSIGALVGVAVSFLGASPVVIVILTGIGAITGALTGAASATQPNQQGQNLEDYLNRW